MAKIERRPIKFRAWDRTKNRWLYPPDKMDSHLGDFAMTGDGRVYIEGLYQDLILCQYTGIKDKNLVEIYEGDIILMKSSYGSDKKVVEWSDVHCGFYAKCISGYNSPRPQGYLLANTWKKVVIGNKFQNGDLLNAKD